MKKRYVIKRYPHGWVVMDKEIDTAIEWYGRDRNAASIAAAWHNMRASQPLTFTEPHPYPNRYT